MICACKQFIVRSANTENKSCSKVDEVFQKYKQTHLSIQQWYYAPVTGAQFEIPKTKDHEEQKHSR